MRAIDAALLQDIACSGAAKLVGAIAGELARQFPSAGIDTPLRAAQFLGQAVYETGYLRRLAENLNYSAVRIVQVWPHLRARGDALAGNPMLLANAAYAQRDGNGGEASGDGWRFRGRGLFMLTGRANYAAFGFAADPDALGEPCDAVASAIAFWSKHVLNELADRADTAGITGIVNGPAKEGLAERTILKNRALRLLTAA